MLKYVLKNFIVVASILGVFVFSYPTVHAQNFEIYSEDDIFVEVNPKVPGPNENVQLRLNSYSFNLNNYYIAWFKDGEKQSTGFGQREFDFTTGASGSITNVTAVIEYENQIFRKELQFSPSVVDLLWEVIDGYTPPFYKGKVLPLTQSKIRISALPETLLIEPSDAPNLVYYWDNNYKRQGSDSGFGRMFYEFTADPLQTLEKITLTVNDRRENSFATNTVDIQTDSISPKILFYEINEFGRLLTQSALNTHSVIGKDTLRLSFHPLFISSVQPNFIDIFMNWIVNGSSQAPQDFGKQNELYISSGGESGTTEIGVEIEGIEKLLQTGREVFSITFNLTEE